MPNHMVLGEKLFEESGEITGFKLTKVHPIEGVTTEVSSPRKSEAKAGIQVKKTPPVATIAKIIIEPNI